MSHPEKSKQTFAHKQEKQKDSLTVTVKLACDKDIVAAAEYSEIFSESGQSAYQEKSAVTSDFNHRSEDYVNYNIYRFISWNDGQNNGN